MTIAPIVKIVQVRASPDRAFALFAGRMAAWWPKRMTIGAQPFVEILVEPRAEGRWFERDASGAETDWGKVIAWEPPGRLLLAWQIGEGFRYDPGLVTELELTFTPNEAGTRVTLEHRHLERLGASAARLAEMLSGGWPGIIEGFASFADHEGEH